MTLIVTDNLKMVDAKADQMEWKVRFTGKDKSSVKLSHHSGDGEYFNIHICYDDTGKAVDSIRLLLAQLRSL